MGRLAAVDGVEVQPMVFPRRGSLRGWMPALAPQMAHPA